MASKREELLVETPGRLMAKLCIPAIIGMVVIGLYSFMDGIFVGQLVGKEAMAAVSIAYPLTLINSGISTLIGIGSASVLSRAIGKKDQNVIDKIMGNLVFNVLLLSIIVTIVGIVFTRPLLMISGANGKILDFGVRYLRIVFIGSIFVNFTQSANMVMRGEGLMKKAMMIMGFGAAFNIIMDPILIKAFGTNGIEGAAVATITSQILQAIVTLYYFKRKSKVVKINKICLEKSIESQVFSVGVSAMMMQVLTIIQQTLLYRMAFKYGGDTQAILMSASLRIQAFSFIPLWGMSQGLQPVVGTNYGAGKFNRVKASTNMFIFGATILALVFWIPIELLPHQILGWFIKDNFIVNMGVSNFRIFYSVFPVYGAMVMIITFFQAVGNGKAAGIMVIFRQTILFIPAILLMSSAFGLPAVWSTQPIVDGLVMLIGITFLVKDYRKMTKQKFIKVTE